MGEKRMRNTRLDLWSSVLTHLEEAALNPEQRSAALSHALEASARVTVAMGTALLRPHAGGVVPWQVSYAGARNEEMQRWLRSCLDPSLKAATSALMKSAPCFPGVKPALFPLHPQTSHLSGLWIVWPSEDLSLASVAEETEHFRQALESFLEVEHKEQLYFRDKNDPLGSEVTQALRKRDDQGLPALLTLARMVSDADFTYWGGVRDNLVEVEWHLGAKSTGFGFQLPVGQGVGGRAFARSEAFGVADYQNCQYRYPGVSEAADIEEIRSTLAVPVRGSAPQVGAVLYAVRRTVAPFSATQRLLLLRLMRSIEPVPGLWPPPQHFFASGTAHLQETKKSELRQILLHSTQVQDIESWLEQLIKGPAILVDSGGRPYAYSNNDRFEQLRFSLEAKEHSPQIVHLRGSEAAGQRGCLYLWPSVHPPKGWPDFIDDVVATCNIVIDRMEQTQDRLNQQRSHWLTGVKDGRITPRSRREGNRLGLCVDQGEVWAIAWDPGQAENTEQTRLRMLAEDVALDQLGSPLVVLDGGIGVFLLKEPARIKPSSVRDEILKYFGPSPLWVVHGAVYDSFDGLEEALVHTIELIKVIRREGDRRYISEVNSWGLDSLLENPKLSDEIAAFADNLLRPLLTYDKNTGTQVTETFCLALALGSYDEVARRLFVHANTIQYRMRRAKQILGRDPNLPKERTALSLAAFVWLRRRADSPHQ